MILAVVAGVGLIKTMWSNDLGISSYKAENYSSGIAHFLKTGSGLPREGWVPPFNVGTSHAAAGSFLSAFPEFEEAEKRAPALSPLEDYRRLSGDEIPPMCMIRNNHVVSYGLWGDELFAEQTTPWDEYQGLRQTLEDPSSKQAYDDALKTLEEQLPSLIEAYEKVLEQYTVGVQLHSEFLCPDPSKSADRIALNKEAVEKILDDLRSYEPPPPPQESNPDEGNSDPGNNGNDGDSNGDNQTGSEDNDPSESPDSDAGGEDSNSSESDEQDGTDESQTSQDLGSAEDKRRDALAERNKAGQADREATESYLDSPSESQRQW